MKLTKTHVFFIAVLLFFITSTFVSQVPQFLLLNKLIGLSFVVFWIAFSRRLAIPLFFKRYLLFIVYAVLFSFLVRAIWAGVWSDAKTMLQMIFMLLLVYNTSVSLNLTNNLKFLAGFLIVYFLFSYFGDSLGFNVTEGEQTRMTGVTNNANALGFIVLYGFIGIIYLTTIINSKITRFISKYWYFLFLLFALLMLPTGSRKSFLALIALFFFYAYLNSKNLKRTIINLAAVFVPFILYFGDDIYTKFSNSIMGTRFLDQTTLTGGVDIRQSLYLQALDFFLENPVFGIGLNNFRYHSITRQETHSYYMEMLTGTGIIGFLIFFSIYFIMGKRALRLYRLNNKRTEAIFILSFIFLTAVMGIGFSYHNSFLHWFIITFIFVFLDVQYKNVKINAKK